MLIAIDHGNKLVKVVHHDPFTSGLQESSSPPFKGETLKYNGTYYTLSEKRIPYHRDKTEDERFFVLTLFAIAYEIQEAHLYSRSVMHIRLAVGLPPAHYGAQQKAFTDYFSGRGVVQFEFKGLTYLIQIENVLCFPQAYAAATTMLKTLRDKPRALIIDQGGMTTDIMLLKNGKGDLSVCESLEYGVITLYNRVQSKVNSEFDLLLEDSDIDAILTGRKSHVPMEVSDTVERLAQEYINDLFSSLRERGMELRTGVVVFVGGGAIRLRPQIEASGRIGTPLFVDDIRANAKGFEMLYTLATESR